MYQKLKRMGNTRALYGCPKEFKYYKEEVHRGRSALIVGRGNLSRLHRHCERTNTRYTIEDETALPPTEKVLKSNIKLRDYQYGIIEEINPEENHEGIIRLDTGWGKTIVALKLAEALQTRTLIIVPRTVLLEQFCDTIRSCFKIEPGVIQGKRCDIQDITVATLQTLQRQISRDPDYYSDSFGLVVVDEAHTIVPQKSRQVIEYFSPKYLYGLTATARRTDQQGEAIFFTLGDILVDKKLPRKAPIVEQVPFDGHILSSYNYAEMVADQVENDERNELIAGMIEREIKDGRKVLVLTKRINHYEEIFRTLEARANVDTESCHRISSGKAVKARREQLESLRSKASSFTCVMGTHSLLGTGFDLPALDTLFLVGDLRSSVLTEQSVGRILRLFEGKPEPKLFDIVDRKNHIFRNQGKERRKWYLSQGWEVKT